MLNGKSQIDAVLSALAEQLEREGVMNLSLLVCGGAALNVLGFVHRTTRDIDIVAEIVTNEEGVITLRSVESLPSALSVAALRVQRDFNLPDGWLNAGPTSILRFGLPAGLMDRVVPRNYGKSLIVHYLGRYDQIHFKLYAVADQGPGKHLDDLLALRPTRMEIESAALWCFTHDVSKAFRTVLKECLSQIGYPDVAEKL
jgi:hypothetical protein